MNRKQLLVGLCSLGIALPAMSGVYFSAATTSEGQKGAEMANATVKGWASGDNARVEFVASGNPMMKEGMYIITRDGGKTAYLVNPKDKTYMKWDMDQMMGAMGSMMKGMGGMFSMSFSNPKVEKLSEEDGGVIVGLPTRHYRYHTSYTMEMKIMGMRQVSNIVKDEEIWAASKLAEMALGIWLRKEPAKTGNEQFDALIAAGRQKFEGFPLKLVTVSTTTDDKGKSRVSKTTMEVTELRMQPVPDSTFVMGPGYTETQLPGIMKPQPRQGGAAEPTTDENPYPFSLMWKTLRQPAK